MRLITLIAFLAVLLSSCASSEAIIGPDGTKQQLISCTAIKYCYEEARKVCGGNYKIINTSSDVHTDTSGDTSSSTNLLIKCDKSMVKSKVK